MIFLTIQTITNLNNPEWEEGEKEGEKERELHLSIFWPNLKRQILSGLKEIGQQVFQQRGIEDVVGSSWRSLSFLSGDQLVKDCETYPLWSLNTIPYSFPNLL